jgi:hypothetical protein
MIEKKIVQVEVLTCDWCGSTEGVRSYTMNSSNFDGHRHEYVDSHIELCPQCQARAFEELKAFVKALHLKPKQ